MCKVYSGFLSEELLKRHIPSRLINTSDLGLDYEHVFVLVKKNDKVLMGDLNENGGELAHTIPFVVFLLSIGIIIPFMEELIYRGIFKETLFKREMFWLPLIITSIVFGGMHVSNNLISFGIYFTMGLILYLSYTRRNNIKDSMMVHMINNSIIAIVMLVNYIIVYFNLF